ncbi:hypothetical protein ACFQWB_08475 [Paenibacillus thermoaerophilus]|uniref:Lipoprotein n=1 Tax=Paenibacillus thermoaerophilus TaxID=1215385 RepID=A0ABW2V5A5_9BACL|nr:hypothetical protein [Paenibacillus thermoaerophilus]TMV18503.1 hypothetical protein FE781_03570 [Paenibacillus thermoaerophilus]
MKAWRLTTAVLLLLSVLLTGCGGPKADLTVFIMPPNGISHDATEKLKEDLQARVGDAMTVDVLGSIIFSIEKLIVEIAAGGHGIFVLPEEQIKSFAANGESFVNLEPYFDKAAYPSGVIEVVDRNKDVETRRTHLYVLPLEGTKWLNSVQYKGAPLYAFIPLNAPDVEKSVAVLKVLTEKA